MRRILSAVVPLLAALLALTACGGEDNATPETTIPASAEFNDADVSFATRMIPHHAQALVLVDLTRGRRGLDPEVARLAEQILAARAPEIELMTDWLEDWDQPVPETARDHVNAEGHGDPGAEGADLPGLADHEELVELADADDAVFEELWVELMVKHHEGALEIAEEERTGGEFPAAVDLAGAIVASQQAEIEQLESLLAD